MQAAKTPVASTRPAKCPYIYLRTPAELETAAAGLLNCFADPATADRDCFLGLAVSCTIEDLGEADEDSLTWRHSRAVLSLIQLATRDHVYLFDVHELYSESAKLPPSLDRLLQTDELVRVGFAMSDDVLIARKTFGIDLRVLDMRDVAMLGGGGRSRDLALAVSRYCGYELRRSLSALEERRWDGMLTEGQRSRAAWDARACFDLWRALSPRCMVPDRARADLEDVMHAVFDEDEGRSAAKGVAALAGPGCVGDERRERAHEQLRSVGQARCEEEGRTRSRGSQGGREGAPRESRRALGERAP